MTLNLLFENSVVVLHCAFAPSPSVRLIEQTQMRCSWKSVATLSLKRDGLSEPGQIMLWFSAFDELVSF